MSKLENIQIETPANALPLAQAARALNVPTGRLRRWVREGCPVAARGGRGRGNPLLVDPAKVLEWREANDRDQTILEVAAAVPEILAAAAVEGWIRADGFNKRALAGFAAASWYVSTTAVLDNLRQQCPAVPELTQLPAGIERLRKVATE